MKILHTSDLHIGQTLFNHARYDEFQALLDWLVDTVRTQQVDVLLIAGDVFDTPTASNRAQSLYYHFLANIGTKTACRHTVVCGGNHDSPTFLDAPRELLRCANVHIVAQASDNPADEVIVLRDSSQQTELIVCAVPYLRDRDVRQGLPGESEDEKVQRRQGGIRAHYAAAVEAAQNIRGSLPGYVPVIAMGHLFVAGGHSVDDDGVRDLSIGALGQVPGDIFPDGLDYVALGHLHRPQCVGGRETVRYSGAPLPMGFGEATLPKSVVLVNVGAPNAPPDITLVPVPVFRRLERIEGDLDRITTRLGALKTRGEPVWIEAVYTGEEIIPNLSDRLEEAIEGTPLEILKTHNKQLMARTLGQMGEAIRLADIGVQEVFEHLLEDRKIGEAQRIELRATYGDALASLNDPENGAL